MGHIRPVLLFWCKRHKYGVVSNQDLIPISSLITLIVVVMAVSLILVSLYEFKHLSNNCVCLYEFKQF